MSTLYTYNKQEFNADVSFNNTSTRISSTGLIGISGGIVNISGGVINMSSYTFPVLYASGDTKLTSRSGFTTFINNDKTSGHLYLNSVSPNSNVIVENGNVGIGNTAPGAKLSVEHNGIQANQTVLSVRTSNPTTDNYNLMDVGHGIGTTPAFVIKAAGGYVGIGTTNPAQKLDIQGTSPEILLRPNNGSDSYWGIQAKTNNGGLLIGTTTADGTITGNQLSILNSGNVGIGNTAPGAKLEVRYSGIVADQTVLKLDTSDTGTSNYNLIQAGHGGVPKFVVKGSGNVGIGTASPTYNLDVADGAYPKISIKSTAAYGTGKDCGLLFQNPAFVHAAIFGFDKTSTTDNVFRGHLSFYTNSDNVLNERMTITAAGNVGIGTTNPLYRLHITNSQADTINSVGYINDGDNSVVNVDSRYFSGYHWNGGYNNAIYVTTSIRSDSMMFCSAIFIYSDARIKTNIVDINDGQALQTLRLIKPKTYEYVDKVKNINESVIGFIAQEIKEIIPKAVTFSKSYIPNFYTLCQVAATDASNIVLVTSPIDLSWNPLHDQSGKAFVDADGNACSDASGNKQFKIKLYDQSNNEIDCKTTYILDKRSFLMDITYSKMTAADGSYFLHGQEVDDFHNIDKAAIFTVVTAAVQDIDRKQLLDESKIAALESQVASQDARIVALEQAIAALLASK